MPANKNKCAHRTAVTLQTFLPCYPTGNPLQTTPRTLGFQHVCWIPKMLKNCHIWARQFRGRREWYHTASDSIFKVTLIIEIVDRWTCLFLWYRGPHSPRPLKQTGRILCNGCTWSSQSWQGGPNSCPRRHAYQWNRCQWTFKTKIMSLSWAMNSKVYKRTMC